MVRIFGKILKALPFAGAALIVTALAISIRRGEMGQLPIALIIVGFALFLAMFLRIEAASLRYYLNLTIITLFALGNVVLLQLLVSNHTKHWDLTQNARYSLAPQTREVLGNLAKPVHLTVWATENEPYRSYLELYRSVSDRFGFDIENPYKKRPAAESPEEEIQINDIWIESQGRKARISFQAGGELWNLEKDIVNGILRVVREERPRLYFTTRHGEKSLESLPGESARGNSISTFAEQLHEKAMDVRELDLQSDRMVPDDCSMLAIVGPVTDFSEIEIQALRTYLNDGGSLLVCLEPAITRMNRQPRLRGLLRQYGLNASYDFVADYGSYSDVQDIFVPLISQFNPMHPITEKMQSFAGQMPFNRVCPVEKSDDAPDALSIVALLLTSPKSWTVDLAEYEEAQEKGKLSPPPSGQWSPIPIAAAASPLLGKEKTGDVTWPRIVVYGDSDFLSDAQISSPHATLGYFTVSWLIGETEWIDIPPRKVDETPMTLKQQQRNFISILSVVIIPFSVFFGGLAYTTIRRRKR